MEAKIHGESPITDINFENGITTRKINIASTTITVDGKKVKVTFNDFIVHGYNQPRDVKILMLKGEKGDPGGGGGVTDYDDLSNRPKINSVTLTRNKTWSDLGLDSLTTLEILEILN